MQVSAANQDRLILFIASAILSIARVIRSIHFKAKMSIARVIRFITRVILFIARIVVTIAMKICLLPGSYVELPFFY